MGVGFVTMKLTKQEQQIVIDILSAGYNARKVFQPQYAEKIKSIIEKFETMGENVELKE